MGHLRRLSDNDDRASERAVRLSDIGTWLFRSGLAADFILTVMALEAIVLIGWRRWRAGAASLRLLPGALLVVALRAALVGAAWPWIALPLALALPAHLADLARGEPRRH